MHYYNGNDKQKQIVSISVTVVQSRLIPGYQLTNWILCWGLKRGKITSKGWSRLCQDYIILFSCILQFIWKKYGRYFIVMVLGFCNWKYFVHPRTQMVFPVILVITVYFLIKAPWIINYWHATAGGLPTNLENLEKGSQDVHVTTLYSFLNPHPILKKLSPIHLCG